MPLLFFADGYRFPDVFHTTKLLTPDPIIALEDVEELVIVASSLEEGRARKESRATKVHNTNEFGAAELASKGVTGTELNATIMKRFLDDRGLTRVAVPPYFPVAEADRLREMGVTLVVAKDLRERRRAKRPDEIAAIEAAQRATEEAWRDGVDAIRRSKIRSDRTLELDGAVFTAERPSSGRSSSAATRPTARSAPPVPRRRTRTRAGPARSTRTRRSSWTSSRSTRRPGTGRT